MFKVMVCLEYCMIKYYSWITILVDCDIFTSEPRNVLVQVGATVTFDCVYTMSHSNAIWVINGQDYAHSSESMLPPKYLISRNISGSFLTIDDVDLSMNGSTHQCIVLSCFSEIGHLFIRLCKTILLIATVILYTLFNSAW